MKLSLTGIRDTQAWEQAGIALPRYEIEKMREKTRQQPTWIHFGAGNIFRAFPCAVLQRLLNEGQYDRGVIACETYDPEIVSAAYWPYDNLSLLAALRPDGEIEKSVIASVAESLILNDAGQQRLRAVFAAPSLQMVSFTVTEKAYAPQNPMMHTVCELLAVRFASGGAPVAMVSMDNCAHNGDKLKGALLPNAEAMEAEGRAQAGFAAYVREQIAFPNTMIDKITPHPDANVAAMLQGLGVEGMDIIKTGKGSVTAPFVNAEPAQYLVIEDAFPAGKPPLSLGGVIFTDRETVDKVEKMKVGTCLNPLHTALAVLGCLLGYTRISEEMKDADLRAFVERLGYQESLPVVEDPGVVSPKAFLDEVIHARLVNPFLPDTPQRIAADTSQKIPVRFGWTIRATSDRQSLHCVPFVLAAWLRYLSGVDDAGNAFTPSADPRLEEVRRRIAGDLSDDLLSDETLFGANLVAVGLAPAVRDLYNQMQKGNGAVRRALQTLLSQ